jgi:hypothetical protein
MSYNDPWTRPLREPDLARVSRHRVQAARKLKKYSVCRSPNVSAPVEDDEMNNHIDVEAPLQIAKEKGMSLLMIINSCKLP